MPCEEKELRLSVQRTVTLARTIKVFGRQQQPFPRRAVLHILLSEADKRVGLAFTAKHVSSRHNREREGLGRGGRHKSLAKQEI